MSNTNDSGRLLPLKHGLTKHFMAGIDAFIPATEALKHYIARDRESKLAVCSDRNGEDPASMVGQYVRASNNETKGLHAPLPMMLLAFGKMTSPVAPDQGNSVANPVYVRLEDDKQAPLYKMRTDYVEKPIQLIFIAHESESAFSMASQMRMHLREFGNNHAEIVWKFGGYDVKLSCTLDTNEPVDEPVAMDSRSNITVLLWNLTARYQVPYLQGKDGTAISGGDFDGKDKGLPVVEHVYLQFHDQATFLQASGHVDENTPEENPRPGEWVPKWNGVIP